MKRQAEKDAGTLWVEDLLRARSDDDVRAGERTCGVGETWRQYETADRLADKVWEWGERRVVQGLVMFVALNACMGLFQQFNPEWVLYKLFGTWYLDKLIHKEEFLALLPAVIIALVCLICICNGWGVAKREEQQERGRGR
ncbi:hypothetical protein FACS1894205_4120 [Alphaproteobacteria bacterium]|nr:hypothetical protein FACS1894205_4120 [Alphaproteobacteria bacterium]